MLSDFITLTQYNGKILGPIAKVLGWITDWIYIGLSAIGINNIGVSIIVLTIVIYTCMLPLTIKQQKFSMMSRKMNPELKAIQAKYKDKKDQQSMMKMQEETSMIYAKYGVSPTGSCVQMLIQMPILFALYRVIYNIPAYVKSVKDVFSTVATGIVGTTGFETKINDFLTEMKLAGQVQVDFTIDTETSKNFIIDTLYKMNTSGWNRISELFPNLSSDIETLRKNMSEMNYFLGLDISNSPLNIIQTSWAGKEGLWWLMIIGAALIPVLSYVSQRLNIALMPQAETSENDQMSQQMQTMNKTMPLFSLVLCFTVPVGLGIYWIASSVVRLVQQLVINKYLDKIDLEDLLAKNEAKARKQQEKMGVYRNQIYNAAQMNTKKDTKLDTSITPEEKEAKIKKAQVNAEKASTINPNSMTAKANMVKAFNERNNKN